jgi:hypothetical protein
MVVSPEFGARMIKKIDDRAGGLQLARKPVVSQRVVDGMKVTDIPVVMLFKEFPGKNR